MTTKTIADILDSIASRNYAATDAEVTALASGAASGIAAVGTYLKVLVAALQARLGSVRRAARRGVAGVDAKGALEAEHTRLYALVLAGVGPSDLNARERNRRATFARTAASTLRAFIVANGDVRALVPADVTKSALRKAIAPPTPTAGTRIERRALQAQEALLKIVERYISQDPDLAAVFIEKCIQSLEEHLQEETDAHGTTTVIGALPPRAPPNSPAPMLHRGG